MELLLSRLPAAAQAGVRWTQRHFAAAFRRLQTEPLDETLVADVAESVWSPYRHLLVAMWKACVAVPGLYQSIFDESLAQATRIISEGLGDDHDGIDTLGWVVEWHRSVARTLIPMMPGMAPDLDALAGDPEASSELPHAPAGGMFRSQILLGAAEDAARTGVDKQRLKDLVDLAFLEMSHGVDASREAMPWLPQNPFGMESPAERGARATRYADALRESGSVEDLEAFRETLERRPE